MAREYVSHRPDVIIASVSIFHSQLRDLLQPGEKKGKVMFVHRSGIESVDFETMKGPTQFCSLDFDAVCLTTGSGLVAAGGEHSELDIRPLPNQWPRWHLRTPTGGSINNNICIQSESKPSSSALRGVILTGKESQEKEERQAQDTSVHKEKRRKEEAVDRIWKRDEPWGRPGEVEWLQSELENGENEKLPEIMQDEHSTANNNAKELRQMPASKTIPLMISNNDRSVKAFRLRPPYRNGSSHRQTGQSERIESGLPGLSRTQTVAFPTCINHSSFSPDGKHVVSVGDTPDVFLFSIHPGTGELSKVATYTASSDASFSTTWSPDSMQFAVASQDGIVSIWDVRSSKKIASLQTSQFSDRTGAGAARVVKWSPRGDVLAFTEQQNYVHIVDTISFETVQRIRVPSLGMVNNTWSSPSNATSTSDSSQRLETGPNVDDILLAAGAGRSGGGFENDEVGVNAAEDWLESTSPARFASSSRAGGSNEATSLARPWSNGRRYRDIGNHSTRSSLDRALIGEWTNNSRIPVRGTITTSISPTRPTTSTSPSNISVRIPPRRVENMDGEGTGNDRAEQSRTSFQAIEATDTTRNQINLPTNEITWQHDLQNNVISAVRSVDSILTGLSDVTNRGSGVWSIGPNINHRIRRRGDSIVEISGLTWDPEGDYLYISTLDLITRYTVIDLRRSFGQGSVR